MEHLLLGRHRHNRSLFTPLPVNSIHKDYSNSCLKKTQPLRESNALVTRHPLPNVNSTSSLNQPKPLRLLHLNEASTQKHKLQET